MNVRQLIEELERMEKAYGSHAIVIVDHAHYALLIDGVIYENQRIVLEAK